jgi:hypothetical protein
LHRIALLVGTVVGHALASDDWHVRGIARLLFFLLLFAHGTGT